MRKFILVFVIVFLVACGGGAEEESQAEPTRAVAPTFTPTPNPTATLPAPTQPVEVATTAVEATPAPTPVPDLLLVPTATTQPVQPTAAQAPQGATANDVANLRGGPGTDFPIVGSTVAGQALMIVGRNAAGDWYQLSDGTWIAAFLVTGAPTDVAVVDVTVGEQPTDANQPVATDTPAANFVATQ